MEKPQHPINEKERLEALKQLEVLDTSNEPAYDKLVNLAAHICGCEIALISLIDVNRQWFKAAHGIDVQETSREISFCGHAILSQDILLVENALEDPRFADNPLVIEEPHIRFYAGMPLIDKNGLALGTLCVIDSSTKKLSPEQIQLLKDIAFQVCQLFELRKINRNLLWHQKLLESYQEKYDGERELVNELMRRMMNPDHLDISAMQFFIEPAEDIGGDLMSAIYSPHGKYYVMLADAAGHGLPAAVSLLPVSQVFYSMVKKNMGVASIVEEMNRILFEQLPVERFVAASILCFDKYNATVEVWNGGMPEIKFLAEGGQVLERFNSTGLPLGISHRGKPPKARVYQWRNEGQLFMCSDGLLEAQSTDGEFFEAQVEPILVESPANQRFDTLRKKVQSFCSTASAADDISFCFIKTDKIA